MLSHAPSPLDSPWVVAAFVFFGLHGLCYFIIRQRLRGIGQPVRAITTTHDALVQYKMYFVEAPKRSWSRSFIYLSVLSLALTLLFSLCWLLGPRLTW
jgi:hypothetical protein